MEMLGDKAPDMEQCNTIIMAARAHWFEGEEAPAEATEAEGGEADSAEAPPAQGETSESPATQSADGP